MRHLRLTLLLTAIVVSSRATSAPAQGVEAQAGRFYNSDGWNSYRIGFGTSIARSVTAHLHGSYFDRVTSAEGVFAGAGVDLSAFRGGRPGPYAIAGLDAGIGSDHTDILRDTWGSWSAGGGWEIFPADFLALGAEARYRQLTMGHRDGIELSVGLRLHFGGGKGGAPVPPGGRPLPERVGGAPSTLPSAVGTAASPSEPAELPPAAVAALEPDGSGSSTTVLRRATVAPVTLTDSVLATAAEMMGRRYQYGGTGSNGQGFDCSGLIQYAYSRHGVQLPRRSVDQAREGRAVPKRVTSLEPGDLLTFSNRGGRVTHVGMYVGDGRFIHSATRGVQVSQLSDDDPYGRWWYKRWVGARRVAP